MTADDLIPSLIGSNSIPWHVLWPDNFVLLTRLYSIYIFWAGFIGLQVTSRQIQVISAWALSIVLLCKPNTEDNFILHCWSFILWMFVWCPKPVALFLFHKNINLDVASKPRQRPWIRCKQTEECGRKTWRRHSIVFIWLTCLLSRVIWFLQILYIVFYPLPLPVILILPLVGDIIRAKYPLIPLIVL